MHITVYINKKNEGLFKDEKEKSRLVNNLLERHYFDTVDGGKAQEDVLAEINSAVPVTRNLADDDEDEETYDDPLLGLVFGTLTDRVYNKDTHEPVDFDATMVKELKRRGQVTKA